MSERWKYPVRPADLIGKKYSEKACLLDANNNVVRRVQTYEEAETVALVMNYVYEVWEPRFRALEKRRRRAADRTSPE